MNWAENSWLYALSFPGVIAIGLLAQRFLRRRGTSVRWPGIKRVLASPGGLKPIPSHKSGRRPWLLLLAATGVIIALARPQWGQIEEPVFERAREVMIALDLSRSMLVEDVPPSRLVRCRLLVQNLLGELRGERVGLIVFAGTAFVQVPMSSDYQILNEFLPEMDADYMPQGGTDYAGMLKAALEGFSETANTDRYLIVLSDGESQTGDWRAHLPALRERDIRVITLGVGTPGGGFIPDGHSGYKKDDRGAVVLSKLEPATLQALAAETAGVYRDASSWVDLKALLEETVARGREGSFKEERSVRHVDRFQWFLGPALALALLGLWREVSVRPRVKKIRQATAPFSKSTAKSKATASAAHLAIVLVSLMFLTPDGVSAGDATVQPQPDPSTPVRETVTRVSSLPQPSANDWLELAEKTLTFGNGLKAAQQEVQPGPVDDAISAATLGQSMDPTLTDWDQLLAGLSQLLEPPQQQQDNQDQQKKNENQEDSQKQQSQGGDSKQDQQQNSGENQQDQSSKDDKGSEGDSQSENDSQQKKDQQSGGKEKENQSQSPKSEELGDLDKPEEQQKPAASEARKQPPAENRKFGGRQAEATQQPPMDAKTAAAMQKLRQVTEGDSPAQLFELLEGESAKQDKPGRDW